MLHTRLVALMLAATTLAASGCGGVTKSSTPTAQATQSQQGNAEFIRQADAICARLNAQVAPIHDTNFATVAPRLATLEQAALADLAKLTPPASIAGDWKQIVTSQQTIAEDTVKLGQYGKANNLNGARTLFFTIDDVQKQMIATAHRDGFRDCSHST